MLQQLIAETGATGWAIASMLFFLGIWLVVTLRVFRARDEVLDAYARLPLEGDGGNPDELALGAGPRA